MSIFNFFEIPIEDGVFSPEGNYFELASHVTQANDARFGAGAHLRLVSFGLIALFSEFFSYWWKTFRKY